MEVGDREKFLVAAQFTSASIYFKRRFDAT